MAINPVTREAYGARSWRRFSDYRFAATATVIRLAGTEISHAALAMPLAFAPVDGKPALVAILGFRQGQNLFVGPDGRWLGRYVPAAFRSWPFRLLKGSDGRATLGFDEASGLLAAPREGEAFFEENGEPSEALKQTLDFLANVSRSQDAADAASALLTQHGLLRPWPLKVKDGDQERPVNGLQCVDEAALGALSGEALLALSKGGALALAYAQLLSMANISILGQLAAAHAGAAQQAQARAANGNGDLTKLFKPAEGQGMIDWKKLLDE